MKKNPALIMAAMIVLLLTLGVASATGEEGRDVKGELDRKTQVERGNGGGGLSTSAADSACWTDPGGDTMNMNTGQLERYPKADIVNWCATYDGGSITLKHRNATPTSPTADPNWVNGITGLLWDIDIHGDDQGDYGVYYLNDGSSVFVDVDRYSDGQTVCTGRATYDGTWYAATFDASCVGNPRAIYADAFMVYDSQWNDQHAPLYGDIADFFGGPVEPSSTPPPSGGDDPQPAPNPNPSSGDHFDDDNGNPHEANINFIYEQGLINGCAPRMFCPNEPLTRAQFATIMANYIRSQQ